MAGAADPGRLGQLHHCTPIGVLKGTDFQYTGTVRKVDAAAIARRLDAGEVVLVPHIGYSQTGEVFNLAWRISPKRRRVAQSRQAAFVHGPAAHESKGRGAGRADGARKPKRSRRKPRSRRRALAPSSTPCVPSVAASRART